MDVQKQIDAYIAAQPEPKRSEMQQLHHVILSLMPTCKLWYLDGKDEKGKLSPIRTLGMDLKRFPTLMEKPRISITLVSVRIQRAFRSTLWD